MPNYKYHRDIYNPVSFLGNAEVISMRSLVDRIDDPSIDNGGIVLDPDYQRGHVWTDEQRSNFVGHLLSGGMVPPIILNRDNTYQISDEVVDGKQRLCSVYLWYTGEIPANVWMGNTVTPVWAKDLSPEDFRLATGISGAKLSLSYVCLSRKEVLSLYLRLNRGGTVHSEAEIARVKALLDSESSLG
jgi:hypothetical protein